MPPHRGKTIVIAKIYWKNYQFDVLQVIGCGGEIVALSAKMSLQPSRNFKNEGRSYSSSFLLESQSILECVRFIAAPDEGIYHLANEREKFFYRGSVGGGGGIRIGDSMGDPMAGKGRENKFSRPKL